MEAKYILAFGSGGRVEQECGGKRGGGVYGSVYASECLYAHGMYVRI